jgi:GGDEF domain-containing protein
MFSRVKNIIREHRELKYLAYHDSLTGLLNRNWLYKNIGKINTRYVYFIDINDLHVINENGHTFGDEHIKNSIGMIVTSSDDTFIRYAGDEFILFSNTYDMLHTNTLFSVGFCEIENDILDAINRADMDMIVSKKLYKTHKDKI